ncbi:hypothetical protein VXE65_22565 [Mycolicibacterium conceptionense]|uniref:hypothetical protein n=1 Tax=Mycolicibacterium conceptionense TaxID=451644 RepID=UPI003204D444
MDYSDPDRDFYLFITAMAFIGAVGVLVYMVVWMIRSSVDSSRRRSERERETEQLRYEANKAEAALVNDMLDWGIPYDDVIAHRSVYTDHKGIDTFVYSLPHDQLVECFQQAARIHSNVIGSFGGRQPAPELSQQ